MTPKPLKIAEIVLLIVVVIGGGVWLLKNPATVDQSPTPTALIVSDEKQPGPYYTNDQYGFQLTMLPSWEGYFVTEESWSGGLVGGISGDSHYQPDIAGGPEIHIHHPGDVQKTDSRISNPTYWQDIAIMIFTHKQWQLVQNERLVVSAAPFPPQELGRNDKYVFALPPRWVGFTNAKGQDEAQEIVKTFMVL